MRPYPGYISHKQWATGNFELPPGVNRRTIANYFPIHIARWRIFYKVIVTFIKNTEIYRAKRKYHVGREDNIPRKESGDFVSQVE